MTREASFPAEFCKEFWVQLCFKVLAVDLELLVIEPQRAGNNARERIIGTECQLSS